MARLQCVCGQICRSRNSFKIHAQSFNDGTQHVVSMSVSRFTNKGPNKVDRRKELERKERSGKE